MLHIFWTERFWTQVRDNIRRLTDFDLGLDPAKYLLHLFDLPIKRYKHSMLIYLLNAAKACITALWKQESPHYTLDVAG